MSDPFQTSQRPLGLFSAPQPKRVSTGERFAIALCLLWLVAVVVFFFAMGGTAILAGESGLTTLMAGVAAFLPVAVILMVVAAARSVRLVQAESQRLQATVDHMRQTFEEETRARKAGLAPSIERKLEDIATAARTAETAVAVFASRRTKPTNAPLPGSTTPGTADTSPVDTAEQPPLALGIDPAPDTAAQIEDIIKGLNFPDDANDKPGFAALRRVLADRRIGPTVQAAQDILTLFAEDGVYMDDLRPDRARTDLWRRFIQGERGAMITALGGVRDRSSLALTAGRMRQDAIFKDAAHHFMRHFDRLLQRVEDTASDAELAALTNTRSAKAFML
ncbi:MAG: hypothetical protein AAF386_06800, partial [Pseudomonadota bacterium]